MLFIRHLMKQTYLSHGENYLAGLADKYVAKLQISCQISRLCYEQDIAKIIRHPCQIII